MSKKKLVSRDVDKCLTYLTDLRVVTRLITNLSVRISQHVTPSSPQDKVMSEYLSDFKFL